MKFSEKKARAIAELHGISEITIRVWKNRGEIPEIYRKTLLPIRKAIENNLENAYMEKYIGNLSKQQQKELTRYLLETSVPSNVTKKQIQQRLIDFRRWLRKKYPNN